MSTDVKATAPAAAAAAGAAAAAPSAPAAGAAAAAAAPVAVKQELPAAGKPLTPQLVPVVSTASAALTACVVDGVAAPLPAAFVTTWESVNRRRVCRRFLTHPVPPLTLVHDLLLGARNSVSSQNNQPWGVCVVSGTLRDTLSTALERTFDAWDGVPKLEYANRPPQLQPRHGAYQAAFGAAYHKACGATGRDDAAARKAIDRVNYSFFGAPLQLIIHAPANAAAGTFLDVGAFLGVLLTLCEAAGLGACPQFSLAKFSATIREVIGLKADRLVVCGFALGYPDPTAPINQFKASKAALSEFVTWHGGADPAAAAAATATATAAAAAVPAAAATGTAAAATHGVAGAVAASASAATK